MLNIIESDPYSAMKAICAQEAATSGEAIDIIQQAFDFILARKPYYGFPLESHPHYYIFHTTRFSPMAPAFHVLYEYNPDRNPTEIVLLAIQRIVPDAGE